MLGVEQFLTKNGMIPVPHPPYSSHLTPSDFIFLFPGMKRVLKGKRFTAMEEVKQTAEALKGIKIDEFKNCLEQWKKFLNSCIASNREYLEGD